VPALLHLTFSEEKKIKRRSRGAYFTPTWPFPEEKDQHAQPGCLRYCATRPSPRKINLAAQSGCFQVAKKTIYLNDVLTPSRGCCLHYHLTFSEEKKSSGAVGVLPGRQKTIYLNDVLTPSLGCLLGLPSPTWPFPEEKRSTCAVGCLRYCATRPFPRKKIWRRSRCASWSPKNHLNDFLTPSLELSAYFTPHLTFSRGKRSTCQSGCLVTTPLDLFRGQYIRRRSRGAFLVVSI
jgi:hypothetical protein